jgi:hypothetical protein
VDGSAGFDGVPEVAPGLPGLGARRLGHAGPV